MGTAIVKNIPNRNKIIGEVYGNAHIHFSGHNSIVKFGEGCFFQDVNIYIGSHVECIFGKNVRWAIGDICLSWDYSKLQVDDDCSLGGDCEVASNGSCHIGRGTTFPFNRRGMPGNVIAVPHGTSLQIGKECAISWGVTFLSNDGHSIFDVISGKNINSTDEVNCKRNIIIGDHVWIGCMTTVLYGTKIGDGSIVGAHSLIKRKVSNNCLVAGNPARIVRRNVAWSRDNCDLDINSCIPYANLTL